MQHGPSPPVGVNLRSFFDASKSPPLTRTQHRVQQAPATDSQQAFRSPSKDQRESYDPNGGVVLANAADQQQGQVPISYNQYSSALMGQGFETLARRRRRVGEVSREHEWVDAADFAAKNDLAMITSNPQLAGGGEEARLEFDANRLQRPKKRKRRSARGRSRVTPTRSGREGGKSRTTSKVRRSVSSANSEIVSNATHITFRATHCARRRASRGSTRLALALRRVPLSGMRTDPASLEPSPSLE